MLPSSVVDVSDWREDRDETLGSKEKVWLREPQTDQAWLFKAVRTDSQGGTHYGDDWAEVVATHLAGQLFVPAAITRLVTRHGRAGTISASVVAPHEDLIHGRELLYGREQAEYGRRRADPRYTIDAVEEALADIESPLGDAQDLDAFAAWAGFLVHDALIGNQDRHPDNWAVIAPAGQAAERLAPSFDHGSSLGFNLEDSRAARIRAEGLLEGWAARGTNRWLRGQPTLRSAAAEALARRPGLREIWLDRVSQLDPDGLGEFLESLPEARLSVDRRTFVSELIAVNRRELLRVN